MLTNPGPGPEHALADPTAVPGSAAEWEESFGPRWRAELAALGLLLALGGAATSLSDPDLPMHLATGEWIMRHRAVPFVEPFAWTRTGAPFYAYSWAIEVVYYLVHRAMGPFGLRLLHALLLAGVGSVMLVVARWTGWRPWTAIVLAVSNIGVANVVVHSLRPQMLLLIAVPLAWGLVFRAFRVARVGWTIAGLVAVSAIAANTHVLFPITIAPCLLLAAESGMRARRAAAVVAAVIAGWLLSPYALVWRDAFLVNFGPNALTRYPSPIIEMYPGFHASVRIGGAPLVIVLALMLIPWALAAVRITLRWRIVGAVLWIVGLAAFVFAARALLLWWLLVLPLAGMVIASISEPRSRRAVLTHKLALYVVCAAPFVVKFAMGIRDWREEAHAGPRSVPSRVGALLEPIANWLDCNAKPGTRGRILTAFDLGSYLTWRLPGYSPSIDGRAIFPDSAAAPEAFHLGAGPFLGPWRSADLAVVPPDYLVAAVLDTARGWRRVVEVIPPTRRGDSRASRAAALESDSDTTGRAQPVVALWVRTDWWTNVARSALSDSVLTYRQLSATWGMSCERSAGSHVIESRRVSHP